MSRRQHSVFGVLEKPAQHRPTHEQLADELHQWQAQGGRIKQLPSGKTGQDKGRAK